MKYLIMEARMEAIKKQTVNMTHFCFINLICLCIATVIN